MYLINLGLQDIYGKFKVFLGPKSEIPGLCMNMKFKSKISSLMWRLHMYIPDYGSCFDIRHQYMNIGKVTSLSDEYPRCLELF